MTPTGVMAALAGRGLLVDRNQIRLAVVVVDTQGQYHLCPADRARAFSLRPLRMIARTGKFELLSSPVYGIVNKKKDSPSFFSRCVDFNNQDLPAKIIGVITLVDGEYSFSLIHQSAMAPYAAKVPVDKEAEKLKAVASAGFQDLRVICTRVAL